MSGLFGLDSRLFEHLVILEVESRIGRNQATSKDFNRLRWKKIEKNTSISLANKSFKPTA